MIARRAPLQDKSMGEACSPGPPNDAIGCESGDGAAFGAAHWLSLAAAPTFAIMALLTWVPGGGKIMMMCSAAQGSSPLGGMVTMYLLMSAFHSAPWLRLVSGRGTGVRRS